MPPFVFTGVDCAACGVAAGEEVPVLVFAPPPLSSPPQPTIAMPAAPAPSAAPAFNILRRLTRASCTFRQ